MAKKISMGGDGPDALPPALPDPGDPLVVNRSAFIQPMDGVLPVINRVVDATVEPAKMVWRTYTGEHAIYGIVLVSALIAVGWNEETDLQVLLFTVGVLGVFWLSHVYAGAVARMGTKEPTFRAVADSVLDAAKHSIGMVLAMVLPSLLLLAATLGLLDEYLAYYLALWLGVAILVVLGWVNAARHGRPILARFASAIVTGALGLGIIWLSSLVH